MKIIIGKSIFINKKNRTVTLKYTYNTVKPLKYGIKIKKTKFIRIYDPKGEVHLNDFVLVLLSNKKIGTLIKIL